MHDLCEDFLNMFLYSILYSQQYVPEGKRPHSQLDFYRACWSTGFSGLRISPWLLKAYGMLCIWAIWGSSRPAAPRVHPHSRSHRGCSLRDYASLLRLFCLTFINKSRGQIISPYICLRLTLAVFSIWTSTNTPPSPKSLLRQALLKTLVTVQVKLWLPWKQLHHVLL